MTEEKMRLIEENLHRYKQTRNLSKANIIREYDDKLIEAYESLIEDYKQLAISEQDFK